MLIFLLLVLSQGVLAQFDGAMVVGVEEGLVRCSVGTDSGLSVGDRVKVQRLMEDVGAAELVQLGTYQSQFRVMTGGPVLVGDRIVLEAQPQAIDREQWASGSVSFKKRFGRKSAGASVSLSNLYGLYRLIDNQRYYRDYASSYRGSSYRRSGKTRLAVGVASLLFNQFGRSRSRGPKPAEVKFILNVEESDLRDGATPIDVIVEIRNTGWHEMRFEFLEKHLFVFDRQGRAITLSEVEAGLGETLRPGESVQGLVRFPAFEHDSKLKFALEDILGKQRKTLSLQK